MQNDLISRQSLMAHFATSQALANDRDVLYCNGVLDVISREPSVDAVPVVRCMECRALEPCLAASDGYSWCNMWAAVVRKNGYCHRAEKMDAKDMDVPTKDGGAEG